MPEPLKEKIKQRTFIAANPERVYDAITSADHWNTFFTTGMALEPHPGGPCIFRWQNWGPDNYTLEVPGQVVEADRPRVFAFQWGSPGRQTTVRMELEARDSGTVVTCTEEGYENTPPGRAMALECASGWGEAITLLKFYIEHGITYSAAAEHT
jgi:uncharacterized protein YndB with AHSA1/START domain